ncbi:MAG: hypothetical protein QNL88_05200 [Acidobacteriota bacterium]|nr:hypothetical protein [Acidobacteriota bacterium]
MRWFSIPLVVVIFITPIASWAQESELVVVPAVAYRLPGFDENLWTSEVYFSNSADVRGEVRLANILPGATDPPETWISCGWTGPWTLRPDPHSSKMYPVGSDLCQANEAVGAYVFEVSEGVVVSSRMVNHNPDRNYQSEPFLSGFGSEIPGIPLDELPQAGAHLLPALIWHPNRCGPRTFDTYVGFANPYDVAVQVVIDLAGDSFDPSNEDFPRNVLVLADSWQQISIRPPTSDGDTCGSPELFDLRVDIDGPLGIYASVVDRGKQDGRIVLPLPIE